MVPISCLYRLLIILAISMIRIKILECKGSDKVHTLERRTCRNNIFLIKFHSSYIQPSPPRKWHNIVTFQHKVPSCYLFLFRVSSKYVTAFNILSVQPWAHENSVLKRIKRINHFCVLKSRKKYVAKLNEDPRDWMNDEKNYKYPYLQDSFVHEINGRFTFMEFLSKEYL